MSPFMGAELAAGALGGVSAYFFLARRKAPTRLEKALKMQTKEELALPPGMVQEFKLPDIDRVTFKEAFLNNTDYKWLATQPAVEDARHPNAKILLDIVWYIIECQLRFVERYGYLLVQRDVESGAFLGAIGLIPPYTKWWRMKKHYQIAALSLGRHSVPDKLGCSKRYRTFLKELDERHQDSMILNQLQEGHWYIPLLGVATASQGHGVGRALTETVTRLCPRPIYLACPDGSCNFFQKVGFALEKRFLMAGDGGNQDIERDILYYNSMTCQ